MLYPAAAAMVPPINSCLNINNASKFTSLSLFSNNVAKVRQFLGKWVLIQAEAQIGAKLSSFYHRLGLAAGHKRRRATRFMW